MNIFLNREQTVLVKTYTPIQYGFYLSLHALCLDLRIFLQVCSNTQDRSHCVFQCVALVAHFFNWEGTENDYFGVDGNFSGDSALPGYASVAAGGWAGLYRLQYI